MTNWNLLLTSERRKPTSGVSDLAFGREEHERDLDRIVFSAPTRRLADKTQVFPMEDHDSVRTRLTHSFEVSNLCRSFGNSLVYRHFDIVFGKSGVDKERIQRSVPAILAAVGLAHDLGNPPFGHQGESTIKGWFKRKADEEACAEKRKVFSDFLNFDGNAQTFRLLTRLQIIGDEYGLDLTCATLAASLKYPTIMGENCDKFGKSGVFSSESRAAEEVWSKTGLRSGQRHPLAYAMEACDDIAYSVIDAEDIIKKGYASYSDLIEHLRAKQDGDGVVANLIQRSDKKHSELRLLGLSPDELNDVSMQMFRVYAIRELMEGAQAVFVESSDIFIEDPDAAPKSLLGESSSSLLLKLLKEFDRSMGFAHKDVLKLELEGHNYITKLMDMLWRGVEKRAGDRFGAFANARISENYSRVFEMAKAASSAEEPMYEKCQLLADAMSGMTESYLVNLHDELVGLQHG